MVPESIKTPATVALDATWADRLALLRYEGLRINFGAEYDTRKLELWLESFGISLASIPGSLSPGEYQKLLQSVIIISRQAGTKRSISLLGQVLGATSIAVKTNYQLRYDGTIRYNGEYQHLGRVENRKFCITLEVQGIASEAAAAFIDKFKQLFVIFQPAWIFIENIKFE